MVCRKKKCKWTKPIWTLQRLPSTRDPSHLILDGQTWAVWWTSIEGKPSALFFFFKLRLDFKQFYQKVMVKGLKQPNSKSITVLKRRMTCDPPMGGRYHHLKYKSFKWFRQNMVGSCVGYEIAQTINNWFSQSTNCSAFFAGIEQDKRKRSSQNINGLATHVKAGHEVVKQSSQNANSPALICNMV